jgi:GxxExxY protein
VFYKKENMKHAEITEQIIGAFYKVYNTLGYGFLEKVYENAMLIELNKIFDEVERQRKIEVFYEGNIIGIYFADIVIENVIIVELKASEYLVNEHEAQLINYLKATNMEVGLLLNFGKKPEFKRKIFDNNLKNL